jgi:hypothetical protein
VADTSGEDRSQQERTIEQLKLDGWVVLPADPPAEDGSVLMQLVTPSGVSHIVVMLNGDRVDARQKLGKQSPIPTAGAP